MKYDGVVYDLDGTLVRLNVDWEQATVDTVSALQSRGIDADGQSLWDLLARSQAEGFEALVENVLSEHERAGARTADLLTLADDLPLSVPTGVCSLNCESACYIALERYGLDTHVDAVVGRDTVLTHKPHPEPLLDTIDRLAVSPDRALFIGDSKRDAITAERAGVEFRYVDEHLAGRD